jgi:putative flippase GtrA
MKQTKILSKKRQKLAYQIVEYLISGGAWFWSGYAMFAVLYSVLGQDIIIAKIISYIFGLIVNFLLQRFWVFDSRDARKELDKVTGRYVVLSVINLGIDTIIVWGLNQFGITPYIGQFVSAGFFTGWNYIWYKLWVFARKSTPAPRRAGSPALRRPHAVRHKLKKRTIKR